MDRELTVHHVRVKGAVFSHVIALLGLTGLAAVACAPVDAVVDMPDSPHPTLTDFWEGRAAWVLDIEDTRLPVGESDTLDMGGGEFWSYLHANPGSAGVVDSCGEPVEFPGCVTRWVSTDNGRSFSLPDPVCLIPCQTCPCSFDDRTFQQQYPRVARAPDGRFYMVFESHAAAYLTRSDDGLIWEQPRPMWDTGVWRIDLAPCPDYMRIGDHPFADHDHDCMAGGPPGLFAAEDRLYIFLGLGQNPGSMGCFWQWVGGARTFPCASNPLFTGSAQYGPLEAREAAANPYFDFRYVTSADVLYSGGYYYMAYEGSRGPGSFEIGGDDQFALGFARSQRLDSEWETYPANPVLGDVAYNWAVGHADLIVIDGVVMMYTGTLGLTRGRYRLGWLE